MSQAVIILGMHRSGTSCLTGCLKSFGLKLGDVSEYNKYNEKGNQEDRQVFRLNEDILRANGGSWNQVPEQISPLNENHTKQVTDVIADYAKIDGCWGIKDPRMLITYPLWKSLLPPHSLLGTFRHPKAVAQSLLARKNLSVPLEQGYELWLSYNLRLLQLMKENPFPLINYDLPEDQYLSRIKTMVDMIGLSDSCTDVFYEPQLKHHHAYDFEDCPQQLQGVYAELLKAAI